MDYLDVKRDDINYSYKYNDTYNLMKNAGNSIYKFIKNKFNKKENILIICGTGNNGGDAIYAGYLLNNEYNVNLLLIKGIAGIKTYEAKRALNDYNGKYYNINSIDNLIDNSDIIIDAIFGIGIKGEPKEPYDEIINKINKSNKIIISIDVPSGFPSKLSVKPDYTITFTDIKTGMDKNNSGEIIISNIGIPDDVLNYSGPGDLIYIKDPDINSHKGMNGTLNIIGGFTYYGSSVIAATGAYNTGIDLVKVYTKKYNYNTISSYDYNIIVRDIDNIDLNEINKSNSILIGPGLGLDNDYKLLIKKIIDNYNNNIILDADALKLLKPEDLKNKNVLITPHKMEFKIFTGLEPTEENAIKFSKQYNIITVLKGVKDIITDGNKTMYSTGGNARMTMGGTGDLLSGIISGLAAKNIDLFKCGLIGTYINKRSGELAFDDKGYYYNIKDMILNIPKILNNKI